MSWSGAVSRISPTRFTIRTRSARACWQEWRSKPALSPGISDAVDASDEQRSAGRRRRGNGRPGGWDEKGADQGETWRRFLGGLLHRASAGRLRNAPAALAAPNFREAHAAWPEAKRSLPCLIGTESLLPFGGLLFGIQEHRRAGWAKEIRRHHTPYGTAGAPQAAPHSVSRRRSCLRQISRCSSRDDSGFHWLSSCRCVRTSGVTMSAEANERPERSGFLTESFATESLK